MLPFDDWARCKPWIEAALRRSTDGLTVEDIEREIAEKRMFLCVGGGSALVCQVTSPPGVKKLHVFLAGGDLNEIRAFDVQLDALARSLGCSKITGTGRKGWARALGTLGYRAVAVEYEKGLRDG